MQEYANASESYYYKLMEEFKKEILVRQEFRKQRAKELGKARIFRKFKRRKVNNPVDI